MRRYVDGVLTPTLPWCHPDRVFISILLAMSEISGCPCGGCISRAPGGDFRGGTVVRWSSARTRQAYYLAQKRAARVLYSSGLIAAEQSLG